MELFILLLFGHLFGDYLLQNDWMALNKKEKGPEGVLACFIHCFIYTITVYIFIITLLPQNGVICLIIIWGIFFSHAVLDRTNLIDRWFRFTRGRSWKRLGTFYAKKEKQVEDIARVVFTAIVQTVADNTIHLLLMYFLCYVLL